MPNIDVEKLAKGAKEGLQKAEILGGKSGEAVKTVLPDTSPRSGSPTHPKNIVFPMY